MKLMTESVYHNAVNKAVEYISSNLNETLDLKTLAQVAHISEYHFHRIFSAIIGEPLATHITRLRLESAAQKLRTTHLSLSQIAEKTGYQSQASLSKAFKKHFGIAPSAFRNIQTYLTNNLSIKKPKAVDLNFEVKHVEKKELIYIRIIAIYGSTLAYDLAWRKLWKFAKQKQLITEKTEYLGLSLDDPNITQGDNCRFYACITTYTGVEPQGEFGTLSIDAGTYAIFTLKGSYSGLNDLYNAIYLQWLPQSGVSLRNNIPFEKYLNNPDLVNEEDLLTQVFIPIKSD